ncbi:unnamed protein product [Eruca vesicaria subsp. sativa]|uniref:RNA exonuclease 4 n=1 Tax=Eruca vesicaria subsp. sativa TaxID=29727 RepID=A0ABC8ISM1_ERUVS|nr:unnamed protein product [Eruca vesicaria subsp. sativa]
MNSDMKRNQKKKNPKPVQTNPNWSLLQQKLKSNSHSTGNRKSSNNDDSDNHRSILGKRKERPDSEVEDVPKINPLAPVNDDTSLTDEVAMDCEMVGVSQGTKSALGRVTLVNKWGNVLYDEFVRPVERVVDFRTHISGIRPRDLRKAKDFRVAQTKVAELIKGKILVGHALHNDLKVLLLTHPKKDIRDTAEYQPFLKDKTRKSLKHLASEFLGADIQNGEHCPIDDARAAMLLYQKNRREWERNVKDQTRMRLKQKKHFRINEEDDDGEMRVMRSLLHSSKAGFIFRLSSRRSIFTGCRAVMLPRFGGPEVLELRENVPVPNLNPNEVLVRAKAVSINPLDCRLRAGYGRSVLQPHLPVIIGRDISGEVAAIGNSVKSFKVGQEVFGALHPTALRGTYTDFGILSEEELTEKPSSVSHVDASAIPFAALTAWRALKSNARILEGQRLLVFGGGAVGFAAIQLGVAFGCHVTASCVGQTKDRILAAGAEQAVDYLTEDIEVAVKGKFDAVLDTIGRPETERIGINFLRKGGNYMTLQGEAASLTDRYGFVIGLPLATSLLAKKKIQYQYSHGIDYWWTYMRADPEGLAEIQRLVGAGKLKIPVEKTFPITEVVAAHEAKEKKLIPGKVVLEF